MSIYLVHSGKFNRNQYRVMLLDWVLSKMFLLFSPILSPKLNESNPTFVYCKTVLVN